MTRHELAGPRSAARPKRPLERRRARARGRRAASRAGGSSPARARSTRSRRHAGTGAALPLSVSGPASSAVDGVVDEPVGGLADEDLARARPPARGGRRRSRRRRGRSTLRRAGSPARTSPVLTPVRTETVTPQSARELAVERGERRPHLVGGADRAQRVVLVDARDAEDGHHRIADELLDHAPVTLDDAPHLREVARHHVPQRLGVEHLAEPRRALDVREERPSRPCGPPS